MPPRGPVPPEPSRRPAPGAGTAVPSWSGEAVPPPPRPLRPPTRDGASSGEPHAAGGPTPDPSGEAGGSRNSGAPRRPSAPPRTGDSGADGDRTPWTGSDAPRPWSGRPAPDRAAPSAPAGPPPRTPSPAPRDSRAAGAGRPNPNPAAPTAPEGSGQRPFADFRRPTPGPASGPAARPGASAAPPPPAASARFPDVPPPAWNRATPDPAHRQGGEPRHPTEPGNSTRATDPAGPESPTSTAHGPIHAWPATPAGSAVPPRPAGPPRYTPGGASPHETPHPQPLAGNIPAGWSPPPPTSRRSAEAVDEVTGNPGGTYTRPPRPANPETHHLDPHRPDTQHPGTHRPGTHRPGTHRPTADSRGTRPTPGRSRVIAAAACMVLGLGLIGGAAAGSWLTGDSGAAERSPFASAARLWHSIPVDELFPPTVQGRGAGPGGADRTWTRIAVAPDSGCKDAFDPLLRRALSPAGCLRLLRATYTDATRSHVTTVGMLFTRADAAGTKSLKARFDKEGYGRRTDLMPLPYPVPDTVAAGFGAEQRASWTVSVLTDAPVVVYAVSGFADGRRITEPQPAEEAVKPGVTTTPAQSGLGHEAQGLADRIERALRKTVSLTEDDGS